MCMCFWKCLYLKSPSATILLLVLNCKSLLTKDNEIITRANPIPRTSIYMLPGRSRFPWFFSFDLFNRNIMWHIRSTTVPGGCLHVSSAVLYPALNRKLTFNNIWAVIIAYPFRKGRIHSCGGSFEIVQLTTNSDLSQF